MEEEVVESRRLPDGGTINFSAPDKHGVRQWEIPGEAKATSYSGTTKRGETLDCCTLRAYQEAIKLDPTDRIW